MKIPSTPGVVFDYMEENLFYEYKQDLLKTLKEGYKVIDIGGGKGNSDVLIAQKVGDTGQVINIEGDKIQVELSIENAEKNGVSHIMSSYYQYVSEDDPLQFEDDYFDIAYANRVLCIAGEYKEVLSEMVRVVKPGGQIIASCPDISTFSSSLLNLEKEYVLKTQVRNLWGNSYPFTKNFLADFQEFGLKEDDVKFYHYVDRDFLGKTMIEVFQEFSGLLKEYLNLDVNDMLESQENGTYYSLVSLYTISGTKTFIEEPTNIVEHNDEL
jgi:ubiquinone/menaquinone biosynthesis C-methylase UbiE